jgi:23S rRNA G2445 N2-methylase RlmL
MGFGELLHVRNWRTSLEVAMLRHSLASAGVLEK